jgi:fluoride exporter
MEHLILVGLGGAFGSVLRFKIAQIPPIRGIPLGTATVNIIGSLVFSLLTFSNSPGDIYYLINVGVLGGFTTFSTFSFETFRMLEERDYKTMITNIMINLGGSLGGIGIGFLVISHSMAGVSC